MLPYTCRQERKTIEEVNDILIREATALFPGRKRTNIVIPWQSGEVRIGVKQMWDHYKKWRNTNTLGILGALQAWKNYTLFTQAHKHFRRQGRLARKNWVDMQTSAINEAASQKDVRAMFSIAKRLCPKARHTTIQFRTQQGALMSAQQSIRHLQEFYAELFKHEQPLPPKVQQPINLQVQEEDVQHRLRLLPAYKAAPPGLAPVAAWKVCSTQVAPWLARHSNDLESIPQIWRDSTLALIPKVRCPAIPKQLRPIGLTEVSGRVIAGIIQERLQPIAATYMKHLPQYAYLPRRTTQDALRRAQRHCVTIYQECRKSPPTVRDYYHQNINKPEPVAGLQVSLDMSQAFDRLERSQVLSALRDAQTPPDLVSIVMNWLEAVDYHISHKGAVECVRATRGVRQGCRISPILWTIYTGYLLNTLAASTGKTWILNNCTLYADDVHNTCAAHSALELDKTINYVGIMLDLLQQFGMQVNAKKSAILYRYRGSFGKKMETSQFSTT